MNKIGVIADVAHSGWKTAFDAAKASAKPMVASHTTCCGVYEHFRGKPDDTIKAICDTGGLVGICQRLANVPWPWPHGGGARHRPARIMAR
jgi:membrane dipeptidase